MVQNSLNMDKSFIGLQVDQLSLLLYSQVTASLGLMEKYTSKDDTNQL